VKWRSTLQQVIRDLPTTGFGAWIIWKQVYATNPNAYLALIGFAFMVPTARAAIITILSTPGQSSSSSPPQEPSHSESSRPGGSDEGAL
jgi:hypothetical protein